MFWVCPRPFEHDGLPMAAHVREQLDFRALVAYQHTALVLAGQCKIVADVWHHQLVPDVAGALLEKYFQFAREKRFVKVSRDWQLARDCLELQCIAQIGHSHSR